MSPFCTYGINEFDMTKIGRRAICDIFLRTKFKLDRPKLDFWRKCMGANKVERWLILRIFPKKIKHLARCHFSSTLVTPNRHTYNIANDF